MIICGFAGIGKSYVARHKAKWVDLESTPFNKDWETYVRVAKHMYDSGYHVMLSCHKELREELHESGIYFTVVIPDKADKAEYLRRYKERGNDEKFIKLFEDNFEKFIDEIVDEETEVDVLESKEYLSNRIL